MTIRTTQRVVTFRHAFAVTGIDGPVAAGAYLTETDEELIDAPSRLAWRRVASTIHIVANGTTQVVALTPLQLDELVLRDERLSVAS
jgi:hypothetical protein